MKIVQSLWSKPGRNEGNYNKCGWPEKKYNYFSWALSALQFRKFYDAVELVTDECGYDLLIRKLGLPYTSTKIVLDELNDYNPGIWALGKIYAYGIQDQPFIHADADVYIWKKFEDSFEKAPILCQNIEKGAHYHQWYKSLFVDIVQHFNYYPEVLDRSISRNGSIISINAGIIGGHNVNFFKLFTKQSFKFIDQNIDCMEKVDVDLCNTIFEQFLFHALAEDKGENLTFFNPHFVRYWSDVADFTKTPHRASYIHLQGNFKHKKQILTSLEYRLQEDYPEYYYRIIHLMRSNQI